MEREEKEDKEKEKAGKEIGEIVEMEEKEKKEEKRKKKEKIVEENWENDNEKIREINDITKMFPKKVILFSAREFEGRKNLFKITQEYLKKARKENKKLIWVTTDQPATKLPEIFEEYSYPIDEFLDRIFFVDIVSLGAGVKLSKTSLNVRYIKNPNDMTDISMTLADLFNDETVGLAIIDSINGLLAFHSKEKIIRFIRFLPTIAAETNTTILLAFESGEHPKELETAIRICTDASFIADEKGITLYTRKGNKKISI